MLSTADVVVIGAGITGASAAFQLAQRGLKVALVEKRFIAAGSTGKSSAIIRQHYSNEITAISSTTSTIARKGPFSHWSARLTPEKPNIA